MFRYPFFYFLLQINRCLNNHYHNTLKIVKYILFFLLIVLLSCSNKKYTNGFNLRYWSSNNNSEIQFSKKMVIRWNHLHPNEKIHYQPVPSGQSSEEIILAAVVAKTTWDIYSNMWQGSVEFYAKSHVLIPLDTLVGFNKFIQSRCDSTTLQEITSTDGHIYQVPWKINPIMTLYNQSIKSDLNIDNDPLTYGKFLAAAKEIKKDNNDDGYIDQWIGITSAKPIWYERLFNFYPLYIAASNGLPLIKNNRAAFNNKYAVEVFRFLQDIYKNNYFTKDQQGSTQDKFISQKVFTKFTGPWEIKYLQKFKPKSLKFNFTNIPVPDNHKGPIYTYCDPKSIVIFNTCRNPQLAFEFIKTMVNIHGDSLLLALTNQLPRRYGIDTSAVFRKFFNDNPELKVFAHQAKYVKGIDNCEVINEVLESISQQYESCVLYNLKSPEQAVKDAEKSVNVLLRAK